MKITLPFIALSLLFVSLFISCKKDAPDPVPESPFFTFFDQPAIEIDTTPVAADTWEYGFVFEPLTAGTITQLGIKLPVTGTFTAKLWDLTAATDVVLLEEEITSSTVHTPVFMDITRVKVPKNARLGVTVHANSFYRLQKQNASEFSFPLEVGNIRIVSFNEQMTATSLATFPSVVNKTRISPCVNVVFIAD